MKIRTLPLIALLLSLFAIGCTHHLTIQGYLPVPSGSRPGAGIGIYVLKASDLRAAKELAPAVGVHSFALSKKQNLSDIVTRAVMDCLESDGYKIDYVEDASGAVGGEGLPAKALYTSIKEFYSVRVPGIWTADYIGNVGLRLELRDVHSGKIEWSKDIGKQVTLSRVHWGHEEALNNAFRGAMEYFQEAISSSGFRRAVREEADTPEPQTTP